jgi:hypothetical protein
MSSADEANNGKLNRYSELRQEIRIAQERSEEEPLSVTTSKRLDELQKEREELWDTMSERQKDIVYAELEAEKKGLKAEMARLEGDILRSVQKQLQLVEKLHALLKARPQR